MSHVSQWDLRALVERLDRSMNGDDVAETTRRVKRSLEQATAAGQVELPDAYRQYGDEGYARRLVHRCERLGYTIVVMTWGPGQKTQLHDHAGIWCVECVLEGELDVTQYDLVQTDGERCRFRAQASVKAGRGEAGCLIPPFEYHVLGNSQTDTPTVTMHVYGGEMDRCNLYDEEAEGWWQRVSQSLEYDN